MNWELSHPEPAENPATLAVADNRPAYETDDRRQVDKPIGRPESFQRVTNADQWQRLLSYYAECMIRETRQKFIIDNKTGRRLFFPYNLEEVRAALATGQALRLPGKNGERYDPVRDFVLDRRRSNDLQLCLGFPNWMVDEGHIAPLIIAPLVVDDQGDNLYLKPGDFEVSYAFLTSLGFDREEVAQVLDECAQVEAAPGQSLVQAIETFLINRTTSLLGKPPRTAAVIPANDRFEPKTLYEVPCLFWVKPSSTTGNLIKELRTLSQPVNWELAPAALKELLSGIPERSYPEAPREGTGSRIYVTEANTSQRRAIAAAQSQRQVIVTGPPGTGKSQLILNLVAQAVINHRTVLFASHNNKAIDVVMSRLQTEVGFDGAVRTGRREIRQAAVQSMSRTLNGLVSAVPGVDTQALWKNYYRIEDCALENSRLLEKVRLLDDQRRAQQLEREDYTRGLPGGLVERLEAFSFVEAPPEELEALQDRLSSFYVKTIHLRDEEENLGNRARQHLGDRSSGQVLARAILEYEQGWGEDFGGGCLRMKSPASISSIQQFLQSWAGLLQAFSLQEQIARQKQINRQLYLDWLELCDPLPFPVQAEIRQAYQRRVITQWESLASESAKLVEGTKRVAENRLSWWEKAVFRLRRVDPVALHREWLGRLKTEAGCELIDLPENQEQYSQTLFQQSIHLDRFIRGCALLHRQEQSDQALAALRETFQAASADFPEALRRDLDRLDLPTGAVEALKPTLADLRAQAEALEGEIRELAQHIRAVLEENLEGRRFLAECKAALGDAADSLKLPPAPGLADILASLNRWRRLTGLWQAARTEKRMEHELSTLPVEEELLQKARTHQQELYRAGSELLREGWRAHVRMLPNAVLQETEYYISTVQQQFAGELERSVYASLKNSEEKYVSSALQVFPVWATTNLSAKANLPLKPGLFDYVVIDEASQCDIPSALPLLFRAKQIVIIGDPNQLRHVATLYEASDHEAARSYGIAPEVYLYNTHSLFDLAQRSAGTQPGVLLLNEHYRSDERIIAFSNRKFYDDRLLIRTDLRRRGYPQRFLERGCGVFWINVPGQARQPEEGSAENPAELRAIREQFPALLNALDHYGMPKASLGIVTPYRLQERSLVELLKHSSLAGRLEQRQAVAGTAHKFQGDERDIILFSPVLAPGLGEGSLRWLNQTANLLNVALTRARTTLLIFGDWNFCQGLPPSSIYRRLSDYVQGQNMVFKSLQETPLLRRQPFPVEGRLLNPVDRASNRTTLRQFILSLQKTIWWADAYFNNHVFDLFLDVLQRPDLDITDIRLLTWQDMVSPKNGGRPQLRLELARALQSECERRGVHFDLGWLPVKPLHDRFLYSEGVAVNMPPFAGAYGDHKMVSEYTRSSTTPALFEQYWREAEKLSDTVSI